MLRLRRRPTPDIPGNEHALTAFHELLASRKAIAFVGAGASAGLYPLWNSLVRQLADQALARGLTNLEDHQHWLDIAKTQPQQAVHGIKQALGDGIYAQALREIFRPRTDRDGRFYTPIHGTLLRMPFRGYVTTNYDPGLLEARLSLRPDSRATGFATWKDVDSINRWITGEIFDEQPCPVLFAHGTYERSDTIVLEPSEYRQAYCAGPYRRLFDRLWSQERLVFVGFGFSDPLFEVLAGEVITQIAARTTAAPRHIALLGLREDEPYSTKMRTSFRDQYNASVVFYRIKIIKGGEDHSELLRILTGLTGLTELATKVPTTAVGQPVASVTALTHRTPQRWIHETTEDDYYVERANALRRLNRWADDPEVRVITVTGLGGLGKTSLVGHWLKKAGGSERRLHRGLFFWSFYADRDVRAFLKAFLSFATEELRVISNDQQHPVELAVAVLRQVPLLLVLDGLEVLQERPGTVAYGTLLEAGLRELLDTACRARHGLVVLTSRFPFVDLSEYLGGSLRALDLDRLTPPEGATLLERCNVRGTNTELEEVSRQLEGHPLGLRVFAATLANQKRGNPTRLWRTLFKKYRLRESDPLERKLHHLLIFYEQQLPPQRSILLGLVSLFHASVSETIILTLVQRLRSAQEILACLNAESLKHELKALSSDHLLLCDSCGGEVSYSCHPVLRDHFRISLLRKDEEMAARAASLLTERPSYQDPETIRELEPIVTAIELLVETGDFKRAHELFSGRLRNGEVFKKLPAFHEGIRCALSFVADEDRKAQCEQKLSRGNAVSYMANVAFLAMHAGEVSLALGFFKYLSSVSCSVFSTYLGKLNEYEAEAKEAVKRAREEAGRAASVSRGAMIGRATHVAQQNLGFANDHLHACLSCLGNTLAYQGRSAEAMQIFEEARSIERSEEFFGMAHVQRAHLMLRLGQTREAYQQAAASLKLSEKARLYRDVACCHWILGCADTAERRLDSADEHLKCAEDIMRRGYQLLDLARVELARADLERCRQVWNEALSHANEALRLAAPRELRIDHTDALIMRGRILFEHACTENRENPEESRRRQIENAMDDAEAALTLARQCGYAWAERDALTLLADVCHALGYASKSLTCRSEAEVLSARLRLD